MVSTSGAQLLPEEAVKTLLKELLPITSILTPNLPEARLLLKTAGVDFREPTCPQDLIDMAKSLQKLGPKYVLLKGGHMPLTRSWIIAQDEDDYQVVFNVLVGPKGVVTFDADYLKSKNTHGTGCSLASSIACNVANGMSVEEAVKVANHYVEAGIKTSRDLGKGNGPINHFHSTYNLPFAP